MEFVPVFLLKHVTFFPLEQVTDKAASGLQYSAPIDAFIWGEKEKNREKASEKAILFFLDVHFGVLRFICSSKLIVFSFSDVQSLKKDQKRHRELYFSFVSMKKLKIGQKTYLLTLPSKRGIS